MYNPNVVFNLDKHPPPESRFIFDKNVHQKEIGVTKEAISFPDDAAPDQTSYKKMTEKDLKTQPAKEDFCWAEGKKIDEEGEGYVG